MKRPKINTRLPGPRAKEILRQESKYVSPSYTRAYPAVIQRGKGVWLTDVDGNTFLDFSAGIGVVATGHCHPEVVEVIQKQSAKLIHMSGTDFYYSSQSMLAEKLAEIVPGAKNQKVFFCNSGTEAVECAMKLARYHKRRPRYIAFTGAFHGRTFGALSLTASKVVQKKYFAPLLSGVTHVPYAYCYRCPFHLDYPSCDLDCVKYIDETIFKKVIPPEEVAAMFVEPIQGEGGYIVPPKKFIRALRDLCDKYDILLVDDEEELVTTIVERLGYRGWSAKYALGGQEALQIMKDELFDIVVTVFFSLFKVVSASLLKGIILFSVTLRV